MIPPVTEQSIREAKAATQRDRDEIFRVSGVRVTDDPMNPFQVVVTRRISAYRQIVLEERHD